MPNHTITHILVQSIVAPAFLASAYCFVAYKIFLKGNIFDSFELYSGLDGLYSLFSDEAFLLVFWLHFLSISLFAGAWIVRDSNKYAIWRFLVFISLILTYSLGWVNILWIIKFFAKNCLND